MFLIVGGDSAIGRALSEYWRLRGVPHHASTKKLDLINASRPHIDLLDQQWSDIYNYQYDAVVFCAAYTRIDQCEYQPLESFKVNVNSTFLLAEKFANLGAYLLLLSSSKVFDGKTPNRRPVDQVCPTTEYGRQKAEIERILLGLPRSAVLRLSKVIHPDMPLIKNWRIRVKAGEIINAYEDMFLAPVSIDKVSQKISDLVEKKDIGIYHLSGCEDISYFKFATQIFADIKNADKLIRPVSARNASIHSTYLEAYSTLIN
jgi:dTDP-4-dehydrorhamnose reductase